MHIRHHILRIASLVVLLALPANVRAQVIAPPLEEKAAEFGYTYKWFDRQLESGADHDMKWEAGSFFLRYGVLGPVTLYAEAGIWDIDQTDPVGSYSRWVVGGGANARLYHRDRWSLDGHFTYNEIYDHDESAAQTDHRTYGWNAGLLARGSFSVKGQAADIYAGPMYVVDVAEIYQLNSDDPVRSEPDQKWGVCAGLHATLFHYTSAFAYLLHVDEPQFRLGLALRTRGEAP